MSLKSFSSALLLTCTLASASFAPSAFAGTLTITCGKGAYDALETENLELAEFSAIVKTKGKNEPATLERLVDEENDLLEEVRSVAYESEDGVISLAIELGGFRSYEISNLTGCNDLDESTGEIRYSYVSNPRGFAGRRQGPPSACNCLKSK